MRRIHRRLLPFALVIALSAANCGPRIDNSRVHLPPPSESTSVGAGDVFTMQIIGERDLPTEYQIAPDGFVNLPYVHRVHVEGLEPQEISDLIRKRMIEEKILSDPSVLIRVREYSSKHILILGQIARVGSYPFFPGLTLVRAISMAGGFSAIAKKDHVNLTRKTKTGLKTVVISVDSIMEGRSTDIMLQAGDQIYIEERIF
ncbi:MAG TPA: polysaccharide biosynthesis/export family protein [Polyangiaceae bacterium]|nr:polysaccharide biosynthesis/export family protein [Polyangiaceae bacterium]